MITESIFFANQAPQAPGGVDHAVFAAINGWWPDRDALVWRWFDDPLPLVLAAVAFAVGGWLALRSPDPVRRRAGFGLCIGYVATTIVVDLLKDAVARPRPLLDASLAVLFPTPEGLADMRSFPSGHVAGATAVVAGLWVLAGGSRVKWWLLLIPLVMAVSRVVLRAHWPTDTLGGLAIGVAVPACVRAIFDRFGGDARLVGHRPTRAALSVLVVLSLFGLVAHAPLAFDPVTGVEHEGFRMVPRMLRLLFEPWAGPLLFLSHHAVMGGVLPLLFAVSGFGAAAFFGVRFGLRLRPGPSVAVLALSVAFGAVLLFGHLLPNDRIAAPAGGVLVDFHLHGGDPIDGGISAEAMARRQASRGVRWATLSWHDKVAVWDLESGSLDATSTRSDVPLVAAEWSGGAHPKIPAPHVLLIGPRSAVEAGLAQSEALAAVRAAKAAGAYTIVAHGWRVGAFTMPTVAEWVAAGVDGFEVGNRGPEIADAARDALRSFDAAVAASGKTRWSFSDDHGLPPSSACVTWVRGLPKSPPRASEAVALLRGLSKEDVVPIHLVAPPPAHPVLHAAAPLRYVLGMRPTSRLSWAAWTFVLALLLGRLTRPKTA